MDSGYDGHISKRQRTDSNNVGRKMKDGETYFQWPITEDIDNVHPMAIFFGPIQMLGVDPLQVPDLAAISNEFKNIVRFLHMETVCFIETEVSFGVFFSVAIYDEDPLKPSPSAVVHVRGLSDTVIEGDLVHAVQHFGVVSYVIMMPRKHQALIEFEDVNGARNCVSFSQHNPIYVGGQQAYFNYSTSQRIQRPGGPEDNRVANHILLFTILNPQYPITVDVMHTICSPYGQVQRIVIFKKNGVQAMVEFEGIESAKRAKQSLNGADIYSGCCTLKIDYAKPTRLNVIRNDSESWDYTNPNLGKENPPPQRSAPLLQDPRYTGNVPTPYDGRGPSGGNNAGYSGSSGGYSGNPSGGYGGGMYDQGEGYGGGYAPMSPRQSSYDSPPERYPPKPPMHPMPQEQGGFGRGPPRHGFHDSLQMPPGPPPGAMLQGAVIMVYGLNVEKVNCEKLFNLFCLYGNVVRIKFLKSKEGSAMVQMGDSLAVERCMQNLNHVYIFGGKLQLGHSKQAFLQDVPNPHDLTDGTSSFKDFMGSRNNRFANPEAASKNRIMPPTKILHYFNAPPNLTDEDIEQVFTNCGAKKPAKTRQFSSKSDRSSTGLVQYDTKSDAIEALIFTNHVNIPNPSGKNPYVFKLCFSATPIDS